MKSKSENKLPAQPNEATLISDIKKIVHLARQQAYSAVNSVMVQAYWLVGKRIVEEEQGGEKRAEYGKYIIATLSRELTSEFGKGFSIRSLREFRQFYSTFPEFLDSFHPELESSDGTDASIRRTLSAESVSDRQPLSKSSTAWSFLCWSHIKKIMRVPDPAAREYYVREAAANAWSVRTLDRNIASQYYQRLLSSQVKEPVVREMEEKTATLQDKKLDFIKNPSVLEFLNLPVASSLTESKIETAIIDNLHQFLLELGKGFAYVERQKLIRTEVVAA